MSFKNVPMNGKILLFMCCILAVSFTIAGTFSLKIWLDERQSLLTEQAMLMARTVSEIPLIQDVMTLPPEQASTSMESTIDELRAINNASYIVVMNMERVRLTHPSKQMVGTASHSEDLSPAFAEHYYTTVAAGEQGKMIRAFAPIVNTSHEQVGVVVVGYLLPNVWQLIQETQVLIWITLIISIACSIGGATLLSRHMKQQMYGLEPHEIAKLYHERTETFNAMQEGVIAIDTDHRITIFNPKACDILGVQGDFIGQRIERVLIDTRLPEIIVSGKAVHNQEIYIQQTPIISNRVPIHVNGETVGAIAIFRDRTEVKALAEELTGVKAFVEGLRVQTHEYKNKLHTIAGLLQLNKPQEALHYITEVKEAHEELTTMLEQRIAHEQIAGLLLSKVQAGNELGIHVQLDRQMQVTALPPRLDQHDVVIMLGNLIENAFDALRDSPGPKEVEISIEGDATCLALSVSDNGTGMTASTQQQLLTRGFSTKGSENRGIGMYLVGQIVERADGILTVESELGYGTTMTITFE
ncbi:ATP-binding protein [Caryophanon tenue]|uniref:histidine kinase n=1 Tax=Caryophanon tenue TaxID=33978 RepID=A0A1C0YN02_9BACL|nr:sensor histidine kinase [Caryophanon tenue]OCS88550.1 histidine kinase [Caryophanon tenue]